MNKKSKVQLVCQHLKKILRKLIGNYPEVIREFVQGQQGYTHYTVKIISTIQYLLLYLGCKKHGSW
jgi:hypothetical protein